MLRKTHRMSLNLRSSMSSNDTTIVDQFEVGGNYIKHTFQDALSDHEVSPATRADIEESIRLKKPDMTRSAISSISCTAGRDELGPSDHKYGLASIERSLLQRIEDRPYSALLKCFDKCLFISNIVTDFVSNTFCSLASALI